MTPSEPFGMVDIKVLVDYRNTHGPLDIKLQLVTTHDQHERSETFTSLNTNIE